MRSLFQYVVVVLSLSSFVLSSCGKDETFTPPSVVVQPPALPSPPIPPSTANTAPKAIAGNDIWVFLPADSGVLNGLATDAEQNVEKYQWRQVSGPTTGLIVSPNTANTEVGNLQKGTYHFELTVTDKGGLASKDTVAVTLQEPTAASAGEIIIRDLTWTCPFGCSIVVDCISCYVPPNRAYKVFVQKKGTNQWVEVLPVAQWTDKVVYVYTIESNNIWIYSDYEWDATMNARIAF